MTIIQILMIILIIINIGIVIFIYFYFKFCKKVIDDARIDRESDNAIIADLQKRLKDNGLDWSIG